MAIRYFSDKTNQYYDTVEAANRAEFEAKEEENRQKILAERKAAKEKEEKEKAAAERKAMAEKVEAARKEMVAAQKKYNEALNAFINKYHTYHFSSSSIEDIPVLFSALNPFKFFD